MHLEILVEDKSCKTALDILVPKIIGNEHTFSVKAYKGLGKIPKGMTANTDASKRLLMDQLPRLLSGYGISWSDFEGAVVVVCDLDDKCLASFRKELLDILDRCNPRPETRFCIAIEEGEAWLLGDAQALRTAFPNARSSQYINDSICGTWERLADAVYKGGSRKLSSQGYPVVGEQKSAWAAKIAPHMDVDSNKSPSFCYFRDALRRLIGIE